MLIKTTLKELENTLFTADHHFNHKSILSYCNRPFANVDEMNKALIDAWNEKVSADSIVYHLGDFTLGSQEYALEFLPQLNGQIKILGGMEWHHDKRWLDPFWIPDGGYKTKHGILEILPAFIVIEVEDYYETWPLPISLCHWPFGTWDRMHYNSYCLHAHSHSTYIPRTPSDLILDVGVDSAYKLLGKYAPFTFNEIDDIMKVRKNNNG